MNFIKRYKRKLHSLSIAKKLKLGFSVLVFLTLLLGVINVVQMFSLAGLTEKLYKHPYTVGRSIRDAKINIIAINRSMKDVALAQNNKEVEDAVQKINTYEKEAFLAFDIVLERFLGDKTEIEETKKLFASWKPIRDDIIELSKKGKRKEAANKVKVQGTKFVGELTIRIDKVISFAKNKGDTFYSNAQTTKIVIIMITIILIIIITLTSLKVSSLISDSIMSPLSLLLQTINNVEKKGDFSSQVRNIGVDEIGKVGQALNNMLKVFRKMSEDIEHLLILQKQELFPFELMKKNTPVIFAKLLKELTLP